MKSKKISKRVLDTLNKDSKVRETRKIINKVDYLNSVISETLYEHDGIAVDLKSSSVMSII